MYHAAVQELVTVGIRRGHFDGCGCGSIGGFGADIQLLPRLVDFFLLLHHGWVPVLLAQGGCKPGFEVASQQKKVLVKIDAVCWVPFVIQLSSGGVGVGGGVCAKSAYCIASQRVVYREVYRDECCASPGLKLLFALHHFVTQNRLKNKAFG